MKSQKDIEKKLVQVRFRHLKKALRTGLSRRPENCAYNAKLGKGSKPNAPKIGVCMFGVADAGVSPGPRGVCDECFGGRNRAAECPEFESIRDASDIRLDFDKFLKTASKGEIAYHYPDIAALLWALGEHPALDTVIPDDEILVAEEEARVDAEMAVAEEETGSQEMVLHLEPWWVRLWASVRRIFGG